ncbi:hypothetical protein N7462_007249 [Penicillium macrosclerotiorum]|uniref:uncharacterized protein n=1 Tax=Penicillium macrosclerotiorum TaxID=303699 RepID=UPI002547F407|nr:uncharacterized protein N7462_007249 [Penicillium macrosclerotiorum]KAJ5679005.1 hypothetical protein N7462_007249 [Penicillium macrosclerotiorum]
MSFPPDVNPYEALGVLSEASLADIRTAYRKRVLKCHPDKIQDESQRSAAQEEFQRVQQAYELLSDEAQRAQWDRKAQLLEMKREMLERRRTESSGYSSPRASGSGSGMTREVRDGQLFEVRAPMGAWLDEEISEEPRSMSRKYEEFGMRSKPRPSEERKKTRTPQSSYHAAKEMRESTKADLADRAKHRDRQRRQQAHAKYEKAYSPRVESASDFSDSSASDVEVYVRLKKPTRRSRDPRDSRESHVRPMEPSSRRREQSYDDDDEDDKHDSLHSKAERYIRRSKYEVPQSSRSPPRHHGYESAEPESRRSARSSRSAQPPSASRNNSREYLDSPRRDRDRDDFKIPKMPTATTSPSVKPPTRPTLFGVRAATSSGYTRSKRGRAPVETNRRWRICPSTPEIPQRGNSPKTTTIRYKIDDEPTIIESQPSKSKHRPISPERTIRMGPKRASTFAEGTPRIEVRSVRPIPRPDVEYAHVRSDDIKYARKIGPDDVTYSPGRSSYYYPSQHHRHPPPGRRQSTYA